MKKKQALVVTIVVVALLAVGLIAWVRSHPAQPKVELKFLGYEQFKSTWNPRLDGRWVGSFVLSNNCKSNIYVFASFVGSKPSSVLTLKDKAKFTMRPSESCSEFGIDWHSSIPEKIGAMVTLDDSLLSRFRMFFYSFQTNLGYASGRPYNIIWCDQKLVAPTNNP